MKVEDFKYLIGTQHEDDEDRLLYQTVRIGVYKEELTQKEFIVGYRKRVLKNGKLDKAIDGPIHIRDIEKLTVQYSKNVLHVDLVLEELLKDTAVPAVTTRRICQGYEEEENEEVNQNSSIYGYDYSCAKRRRQTVEGKIPQHDLDTMYAIDQVGTLRPRSEDPLGLEGTDDGGRTPHSSFTSKDGKFADRRPDKPIINISSTSYHSNRSVVDTVFNEEDNDEDDELDHQYNTEDFIGLPKEAKRKMEEMIPQSINFKETVLSLVNTNSLLNRKMRRTVAKKLTQCAKQGDPIAVTVSILNKDPSLLQAYQNGYREPANHTEAMSTEDAAKWREAEEAEIHSMLKNKVYEMV